MTTKVKITAEVHQADRQVKVDVICGGNPQPAIFLRGEESTEVYVYDGQTISVSEVEVKPEVEGTHNK